MSYVLDTDTLTLLRCQHSVVLSNVRAHRTAGVAVTVISLEEQLGGWYSVVRKARQRDDMARAYQSLADTVAFLADFAIRSFTVPAIIRFDSLRAQKLRIGSNDLRIAAIALEANATVVSRNLRDFGRVPGLSAVDWALTVITRPLALRAASRFGETPINHQRFARLPQHDVARLQVAVQNAAAVGVGDGLANVDEALEQPAELQRVEVRRAGRVIAPVR